MSQLSQSADGHDPFWDVDGKGARRTRSKRRFMRTAVVLIAVLLIAVVVTHLPTVDPTYLTSGDGKPILAVAILLLLGSSVLIALSRMRGAEPH